MKGVRHACFGNTNAAGPHQRRGRAEDDDRIAAEYAAEIIGQAVHELTTDINHRLAHPVGLDEDCRVLGRVIAKRLRGSQ